MSESDKQLVLGEEMSALIYSKTNSLYFPQVKLKVGEEWQKTQNSKLATTGYADAIFKQVDLGLSGEVPDVGLTYTIGVWKLNAGKVETLKTYPSGAMEPSGTKAEANEGISSIEARLHLWQGWGPRRKKLVFDDYRIAVGEAKVALNLGREELFRKIVGLHLEVYEHQENIKILRQLIESNKQQLEANAIYEKRGGASQLSLLIIRQNLASLNAELKESESQKKFVETQLCETMGLGRKKCFVGEVKPISEDFFPAQKLDLNQSVAIEHAHQKLARQSYNKLKAEEDERPSVDLVFSRSALSDRQKEFPKFLDSNGYDQVVGIELTIPMDRDLVRSKSAFERAKEELALADVSYRLDEQRNRALGLKFREQAMRTALLAKGEAVKLSEQKLKLGKEQLRLGLSTQKDISDFENEYLRSSMRLISMRSSLIRLLFEIAMYSPNKSKILLTAN